MIGRTEKRNPDLAVRSGFFGAANCTQNAYSFTKSDKDLSAFCDQLRPFGEASFYVKPVEMFSFLCGAGDRTRTDDLLITNQLLYQLSYAG